MGPLEGVKIVELAGIGPGPFAAMLLAEMGATVIRVDRKQPSGLGLPRPLKYDLLLRSRPAIRVDLKDPGGLELVMKLVDGADALIEGFRPGVTERLGLGPDDCFVRNPRLVYGRMTGWGQQGPLAMDAGHDPNYIGITGVLHGLGREGQPPTMPFNLLGDFAGGTLYLVMGLLAGIIDARHTGVGQVVDAAIVDGTANLLTGLYGQVAAGTLSNDRGTNFSDGGSPVYNVYECADGRYMVVGAIEEKFFIEMMGKLDLDPAPYLPHQNKKNWPALRAALRDAFKTRTRDEWATHFEGSDSCVAPVLDWTEAPRHPHLADRNTFVDIDGVIQPAPAPRFSRTPSPEPTAPQPASLEGTIAALGDWLDQSEIAALTANGTID